MEEALNKFEGDYVKLVFRDGDTVVAKRGDLISTDRPFVELKTKEIDMLVNVSDIVKIQKKREKVKKAEKLKGENSDY